MLRVVLICIKHARFGAAPTALPKNLILFVRLPRPCGAWANVWWRPCGPQDGKGGSKTNGWGDLLRKWRRKTRRDLSIQFLNKSNQTGLTSLNDSRKFTFRRFISDERPIRT